MAIPPEHFNLFLRSPDSSFVPSCLHNSNESRRSLHDSIHSALSDVLSRKDLLVEKTMWLSDAVSQILLHYSIDLEAFFSSHFGTNSRFTYDIVLKLCQFFPKEIMEILESHSNLWPSFFGYFEVMNAKLDGLSSETKEESDDEFDRNIKSPNVKFLSQLSVERIKKWFGHISSTGEVKLGARALKWYFLANRDRVWNLTTWTGKCMITPPVLAKRSQYFMQMDIVGTVCNLLSHSEFWKSRNWIDVMKEGDILSLDYQYFANYLSEECINDRKMLGQLKSLFSFLLMKEKVSDVCRFLFLSSKHQDCTLRYVKECMERVKKKDQGVEGYSSAVFDKRGIGGNNPLSLMLLVLCTFSDCSFEDLTIYVSVAFHTSALFKTIGDNNPFSSLVECGTEWETDQHAHWEMRGAVRSNSPQQKLRFILLESFIIRCRLATYQHLSDFEQERKAYERIFSKEGIEHQSIFEERKRKRKSSKHWVGWEFHELYQQQKLFTIFELPETLSLLFIRSAIKWFTINH